jgi:hypothetical protein
MKRREPNVKWLIAFVIITVLMILLINSASNEIDKQDDCAAYLNGTYRGDDVDPCK